MRAGSAATWRRGVRGAPAGAPAAPAGTGESEAEDMVLVTDEIGTPDPN